MSVAEWEKVHAEREWGEWPSEALVRWIGRTYRGQKIEGLVALDLGCGAGSNTIMLAKKGFSVVAVDGSRSALHRLMGRLDNIETAEPVKGILCDLSNEAIDLSPNSVDLVVDVACLQTLVGVERAVESVMRLLKSGGMFFSMTAASQTSPSVHGGRFNRDTTIGEVRRLYGGKLKQMTVDYEERSEGPTTLVRNWIIKGVRP